MQDEKRFFLITIDTEGDYIWNRNTWSRNSVNNRITVRNGKYIERFQKLCEKYHFKPTYLVDYEMCSSEDFVGIAKDGIKRNTLEIGMHMHSWSCPPYYELKRGKISGGGHPYIGEYPNDIIDQKVYKITEKITKVFGVTPRSHRSGRWYLNEKYINILKKYGYLCDCSVTPGIDWRNHYGLKDKSKGNDYRYYPNVPYEISKIALNKQGNSGVYEIPLTTLVEKNGKIIKLRPYRHNINEMINLVRKKYDEGFDYLEFMLHSSELMRAGSPNFLTEMDIEILYEDMDNLFSYISDEYIGATLSEYTKWKWGRKK